MGPIVHNNFAIVVYVNGNNCWHSGNGGCVGLENRCNVSHVFVHFALIFGCNHCRSKGRQYLLFNVHYLIDFNSCNFDLTCLYIIMKLVLVHKVDSNNVICELIDYVNVVFESFAF